MKILILLLSSLFFLPSCEGTKLTPQIALNDAISVAAAGGIGYLEGGKVGAVVGMTAAEASNLRRLTAAKNPPRKSINP